MTTGEWIRKLRCEQKMSQQELADRAGLSFSFVNQVEGGKQTVRLDALNKLLTVFGYTMKPSPVSTPRVAPAPTLAATPEPEVEVSAPPVTIHRPKNDWSYFD